ncbi:radical SAM protein [Solidesulfovibrio sp.]|uniref:radical SAM protein n=1 Tax=Solidesulfovibrio sp. TaxID=2910990 RepID=UPI00262AE9A3|nr:radical SAM protein [Solidesulfovibrio sp.]
MRRDKEDRATDAPRFIFGPVVSGRLGLSLGLDLLGARICSFDCLYCEAGPTEALTVARKPYVPAGKILAELARWKAAGHGRPDAVTLGGLGEPTLNSDCAEIIAGAKELFPGVPVAVLTNSSLLPDPDVRAALGAADIVLPSMDTLVAAEYARLNRPHAAVDLGGLRRGLLDFRAGYGGALCLEVLLADGINDSEENLEALRDYCRELSPDRVDVVTLSRPGAHPGATAVLKPVLARFRQALGPAAASPAPAPEPATEGHGPTALAARRNDDLGPSLLASVKRRPQTARGLAAALGHSLDAVQAALDALERDGAVRQRVEGREIFYSG